MCVLCVNWMWAAVTGHAQSTNLILDFKLDIRNRYQNGYILAYYRPSSLKYRHSKNQYRLCANYYASVVECISVCDSLDMDWRVQDRPLQCSHRTLCLQWNWECHQEGQSWDWDFGWSGQSGAVNILVAVHVTNTMHVNFYMAVMKNKPKQTKSCSHLKLFQYKYKNVYQKLQNE